MSDRASPELPGELARLLDARTPHRADAAWSAFVAAHTRLLLHVARASTADHDGAMDAYAYVLGALREDDCRRLRGFSADGRGRFTTWLVVVARRLCNDWYRQRFGRARAESSDAAREALDRRRRLAVLVADVSLDAAADVPEPPDGDAGPEERLRALELTAALDAARSALPIADQLLLKLRFDDGLSAQAVALALRFPTPFHVYRRIDALLATLRATLRARGIESSVP